MLWPWYITITYIMLWPWYITITYIMLWPWYITITYPIISCRDRTKAHKITVMTLLTVTRIWDLHDVKNASQLPNAAINVILFQ
jgi:hypothetical protein